MTWPSVLSTSPSVDDLEAAEGEGEAAGHGVGLERRLVDRVGPVALRHGEPAHAAAVLDRRD